MPLTALIIDDEPLARQELQYLLERAGGVEVLAQGTNGIEAVELIRTHHPDVVFLDVQMPGLDGFAVLKKLLDRKMPLAQVVFATAFDQYAVRAFEVNAVDYLLKPFDRKRVLQTIEKVHGAHDQRSRPTTQPATPNWTPLLQAGGQNRHAARSASPTPARSWCARRAGCCWSTRETSASRPSKAAPSASSRQRVEGQSNCRTLEELLDQLDPEAFWRAHRSYVVNIQHIREVVPWFKSSYQLRMDDPKKTEIPVSRAQTKRLNELFNL